MRVGILGEFEHARGDLTRAHDLRLDLDIVLTRDRLGDLQYAERFAMFGGHLGIDR